MPTPAATLGTPTIHGGAVSTAAPCVTIGGIPAARVGDMVTCPTQGSAVITSGSLGMIDGRQIDHHSSSTHLPDAGTVAWQHYGSGDVHGVLLNGEPLAAFERDALHRETLRTQGLVAHAFSYSPAGCWRRTTGRVWTVGAMPPRHRTSGEAGSMTAPA